MFHVVVAALFNIDSINFQLQIIFERLFTCVNSLQMYELDIHLAKFAATDLSSTQTEAMYVRHYKYVHTNMRCTHDL